MGKLFAVLAVLRTGGAVADPSAWRRGAVKANMLAAFLGALVAVARSFGIDLGLDDAGVAAIAGGVLAVVNACVHVATDARLGLPSLGAADSTAGAASGTGASVPAGMVDPNRWPPGGA